MDENKNLVKAQISDQEITKIIDYFSQEFYRTLIDIFPEQIGSSSKNYWDIYDYLIDNEFGKFLDKSFNIIIKFICYYEYTYIITQNYSNGDIVYNAYSFVSVEKIKEMLLKVINKEICTFYMYFKDLNILLSLDNDSILICIEGLKDDNRAFQILEKLSVSEGLFIKGVFDDTINDKPNTTE